MVGGVGAGRGSDREKELGTLAGRWHRSLGHWEWHNIGRCCNFPHTCHCTTTRYCRAVAASTPVPLQPLSWHHMEEQAGGVYVCVRCLSPARGSSWLGSSQDFSFPKLSPGSEVPSSCKALAFLSFSQLCAGGLGAQEAKRWNKPGLCASHTPSFRGSEVLACCDVAPVFELLICHPPLSGQKLKNIFLSPTKPRLSSGQGLGTSESGLSSQPCTVGERLLHPGILMDFNLGCTAVGRGTL